MRFPVLPIVVGLSLLASLCRVQAESPLTADDLARLQQRAGLVTLLSIAVVMLALAVVLLGWMLWRRPKLPSADDVVPPALPVPPAPVVPTEMPGPVPAAAPAPAEADPLSVTMAQPAADHHVHGVSIEEHIDIDQQAQFLSVLGQDDAAIDLLLDYLRGTGGTSPLPYLRLMQIYRKHGDEEAYERTRGRFNLRFNALAPLWKSDPESQRSLENYPAVLARVQRAWDSPLNAMAVIEALLFRRGSEDERFDLPAYEELLFLYWLTRELQQSADSPPDPVDVLLPLDDEVGDVSVIERQPPAAVFRGHAIDLDLSTVPGPDEDKLR